METTPQSDTSPPEDSALEALLLEAFHARTERDSAVDEPPSVIPRPRAESATEGFLGADGRYELLGEVGRGGVGIVYRGQDTNLGRELAIKVLGDTRSDDDRARERFLDEARICAQLEHPGIVPVYELDETDDDRPFFTMRLVEGRTLGALLDERESVDRDRPRTLSVLLQLFQAVAYAHARGIVHRDLKPSNVMVGAFGEVQVLDWGLAKIAGTRTQPAGTDTDAPDPVNVSGRPRTLVGSVSGTPAYMAPEQARGEPTAADPRADVFALGAILCEVLTGAPPFQGESVSVVRRSAAHAELDRAFQRLAGCSAEPDLITLALRCLAPDRDDRPRDAGAVAEELEAHLDGVQRRAEEARLAAVAANAQAAMERRAKRATVALLALVVVFVVTAALVWRSNQNEHSRRAAQTRAEVDSSLDAALTHRTRGDLASLATALEAVSRAEAAVASGVADTSVRERIATFRTETEDRAAAARSAAAQQALDVALVESLDAAREDSAGRMSVRSLHSGYAAAFAAHGIGLDDEPAAIEQLRASGVRAAIIDALNHWAAFGGFSSDDEAIAATRARAYRLADAIDEDPFRRSVRAALRSRSFDDVIALTAANAPAPTSWSGAWMIGEGLLNGNEPDAAVRAWKSGVRAFPESFWLHYTLGIVSGGTDVPAAETHLAAAVALRPRSGPAWNNLALHYLETGDDEDARHALEQAVRYSPDRGPTYYNLWVRLTDTGDHASALDVADSWFDARPDDGGALLARAETLGSLGRGDERLAAYREALPLARETLEGNPRSAALLQLVAKCERALGENEAAIETLTRLIDVRPGDFWANHELGHAQLDTGHWEDAEDSFTRALESDPDSPELLTDVAIARFYDGRAREALVPLHRAQELNGKRPTANEVQAIEEHARMADLVDGIVEPRDVQEMMRVAVTAAEDYDDFVTAARFYGLAFDTDLSQSGGAQFFAGCCAARAAAGEGKNAQELSKAEREKLRGQAYTWLRRLLDELTVAARTGRLGAAWIDQFTEWRPSPALKEVREPEHLAAYSEEERLRWEALWRDLDAFLEENER